MLSAKSNNSVGVFYLLVFILIGTVNDLWSNTIGLPTLYHIYFVFLVIFVKKYKFSSYPFIRDWVKLLIFYLLVVLINSIVTLGKMGLHLNFVSVIMKSFMFLVILPYFLNLRSTDYLKFFKLLLIGLVFTVLLPGLYEHITQESLLTNNTVQFIKFFYLRAFTTDKIDFGFNLIMIIACCLVLFKRNKTFIKLLFCLLIGMSLFFLVLSFSSTNILGLLFSVLFYLLFYSKQKVVGLFFVSLAFFVLLLLTSDFTKHYEEKAEVAENGAGDKEFRSRAVIESVGFFADSPFFGHGAEMEGFLLEQKIGWLGKSVSSHNFISEFTNYGLLGGFPALLLFTYIVYLIYKRPDKNRELFLFWLLISGPLLARLLLYYHRFDKPLYFLWFAIAIMMLTEDKKVIND
jgi:O-antigen ligase